MENKYNFLVLGDWGGNAIEEAYISFVKRQDITFKQGTPYVKYVDCWNKEYLLKSEIISCNNNLFKIKYPATLSNGGYSYNEKKKINQKVISLSLSKESRDKKSSFLLNTGDNFYWYGLTEERLWDKCFENIYKSSSLMMKWYSCLGNHDYANNPEKQVNHNSINDRWVMPNRYYYKRIKIDNINISLIVIDTTPLVKSNREYIPSEMDPCGVSPSVNSPVCVSKCSFLKKNINDQSVEKQIIFLKNISKKLKNNKYKNDWIILMGHNPIEELVYYNVSNIITEINPDVYFCGHVHELSHHKMVYSNGVIIETFLSGAGSMPPLSSEWFKDYSVKEQERFLEDNYGYYKKIFGEDEDLKKIEISAGNKFIIKYDQNYFNKIKKGWNKDYPIPQENEYVPFIYNLVYANKVAGFFSCNIDNCQLEINYKNYKNETIYSHKLNKKIR